MKKVYVVTEGNYSDYHIVAVFSTEEMAKDFVAHRSTECGIEEYPLDEEYERGDATWRVYIDPNSFSLDASAERRCADDGFYEKYVNTCQMGPYSHSDVRLVVRADTSERAIKVAREHLGAIKANEYLWQKMNTKKKGASILEGYPIYNFKEERFIEED